MNTEIICALISVGGIFVSGLLSWFVSRSTAKRELVSKEHTWAHEAVISSDDEFAAMAAAVGKYTSCMHTADRREATSQVASLRAKERGTLADALDALYSVLQKYSHSNSEVDRALAKVIEEKRKASSQEHRTNGKQKKK